MNLLCPQGVRRAIPAQPPILTSAKGLSKHYDKRKTRPMHSHRAGKQNDFVFSIAAFRQKRSPDKLFGVRTFGDHGGVVVGLEIGRAHV